VYANVCPRCDGRRVIEYRYKIYKKNGKDYTYQIDEEQCNSCSKYDYPNYNKGEVNA
tara:strand:+ start:1273 stop:1443 length:171 start_codon:yes stop_codon:yes gene_type:complete